MKKKRIVVSLLTSTVLLVLLVTLGLSSCGGSGGKIDNDDATLNTTEGDLAPYLEVTSDSLPLLSRGKSNAETRPIALTLVGKLSPPSVDGNTLQATDVVVSGNTAFVSFNVAGDVQKGAVYSVDVSNRNNPKLTSSLVFANSDINALYLRSGSLYIVGATTKGNTAFIRRNTITGKKLTLTAETYSLSSFAGTDVYADSSKVYATSGDAGHLQIFNRIGMGAVKDISITDARSVDVMGNGSIGVAAGQPGKAYKFDANGTLQGEYSVGGATIAQSKSTIQGGSTWSVLGLGDGGTKIICNATGAVITTIPQIVVDGLSATKSVTNAAYTKQGLLFTASGEAGLYLYSLKIDSSKSGCDAITSTLQGHIDFGASLSANYVHYQQGNGSRDQPGVAYVADGLGGLKIVTVGKSTSESDDCDDFDDHDDHDETEDHD